MQLSAPIYKLKRQAKLMAREHAIPLHKALDQIARREGFTSWSHLASTAPDLSPALKIATALEPGQLLLLGARPHQGKTLLGLEIAAMARSNGRHGMFFTLDYNRADVLRALAKIGLEGADAHLGIDTSDNICASHIMSRLSTMPSGVIAVVDYLQLLDQKRAHPPLQDQLTSLRNYAKRAGETIIFLSQIDRTFELSGKDLPGPSDVRCPNALDLSVFDKLCFVHGGEIGLQDAA